MNHPPDLARKNVYSDRLKHYIDLNTDLGQSRDAAFFESTDYHLLNFVSSVNIPCAVHDSTPKGVMDSISKAKTYNCAVGAHIAYPDAINFGYNASDIDLEELKAWILLQVGGFQQMAKALAIPVDHVRPHGALYTALVDNPDVARVVAEALYTINPWIMLVGPAGPVLDEVSKKVGLRIIPEIIVGKKYTPKGLLSIPELNSPLSPQGTFEQAKQLIHQSQLTIGNGNMIRVSFKSLHLSANLPDVLQLSERLCNILGQPIAIPLVEVGATGWL